MKQIEINFIMVQLCLKQLLYLVCLLGNINYKDQLITCHYIIEIKKIFIYMQGEYFLWISQFDK